MKIFVSRFSFQLDTDRAGGSSPFSPPNTAEESEGGTAPFTPHEVTDIDGDGDLGASPQQEDGATVKILFYYTYNRPKFHNILF